MRTSLASYGLSSYSGFLSREAQTSRLKDDYYRPWEDVVSALPQLLQKGIFRRTVEAMPLLEVRDSLVQDIDELRRAYQVLCFLANAYVWGKIGADRPSNFLADNIANPLLKVSEIVNLPPISTYASLVLWNFTLQGITVPTFDLESCQIINSFTNTPDEKWFYMISIIYEKVGASALQVGLDAIEAAYTGDSETVVRCLNDINSIIEESWQVLNRMDENCDPVVFYNQIRPYLAGWKNMGEGELVSGVKYGTNGPFLKLAGGSNAQSSLVQYLDIILGIKHFPLKTKEEEQDSTKVEEAEEKYRSFVYEMRNYMPKEHRDFLNDTSDISCVRKFVIENQENASLTKAYNTCLETMKKFRDRHLRMVTRYIIVPANKQKNKQNKSQTKSCPSPPRELQQRGTGSTNFVSFLKQCRDETTYNFLVGEEGEIADRSSSCHKKKQMD